MLFEEVLPEFRKGKGITFFNGYKLKYYRIRIKDHGGYLRKEHRLVDEEGKEVSMVTWNNIGLEQTLSDKWEVVDE